MWASAPTKTQQEVQWAGDRKGRPYGGFGAGAWVLRIATAGVRTGFAMTPLTRGAVQVRAGRCGERTERCRWQKQRSERVAAVKILSVRRKAAQKFWAPQQDHRPLRRGCKIERRGEGTPPYGGVTRSACMRADRGVRPYGSVTGGAMGGRPQGSPLRRAARNVWAGYRPLRKFFDREGMVCFGFWWRRMTRAPGC